MLLFNGKKKWNLLLYDDDDDDTVKKQPEPRIFLESGQPKKNRNKQKFNLHHASFHSNNRWIFFNKNSKTKLKLMDKTRWRLIKWWWWWFQIKYHHMKTIVCLFVCLLFFVKTILQLFLHTQKKTKNNQFVCARLFLGFFFYYYPHCCYCMRIYDLYEILVKDNRES